MLPVAQAAVDGEFLQWRFDKRFHVSPFMAMEHDYHWRFDVPGQALRVHMDVLCPPDPGGHARRRRHLTLRRRPMTGRHMARRCCAIR